MSTKKNKNLTAAQKELREKLNEQLQIKKARKYYLDYVKYTTPDYMETKFHKFLCKQIEDFVNKPSKSAAFDVLLLSVPPQHGKSLTVSEALPSWHLGKNPKDRVILASYNEELAKRFGRRNREKIMEFHPTLFPECQLAQSPNNNTMFETTLKGGCMSAGILGGITGNKANLIIIDDVLKNREEADSPSRRDKIWGEYLGSVRTRIAPGAKVVVIGTRWHEEDLIGMLEMYENSVTTINLPCECEDPENDPLGREKGDPLCPEIGRGKAWLEDFKKIYISEQGSRTWSALYQGKPVALEGNMIKRDWWKWYDYMDVKEFPYVILSVDATFKDKETNDFVAIEVWGKINRDYYLIDGIKKRLSFTETLKSIRSFVKRYPEIMFKLIEDKANGSAIINVLSKEMDGIIPVEPEGGKVARINAVSPAIEDGRVYLPKNNAIGKELMEDTAFSPAGAHDDVIDCAAQALNRMIYVDADYSAPANVRYTEWQPDMWEDFEHAGPDLQVHLLELWGHPMEFKE